MEKKKKGQITFTIDKFTAVLLVMIVALAFAVGYLFQKVDSLEKGTTQVVTDAGAQPVAPKIELSQIKELFNGEYIQFGDADKETLFVAVEDPSCPYCHIATGKNPTLNASAGDRFKLVSDGGTYTAPVPEMKKLVEAGKASLVYIYVPGHGNGEMGMKAMYCAFDQGKFWQAHDMLYTSEAYDLLNNVIKNDKAKSGELSQYLAGVVNAGELKTCLDSGKYDARLTEEAAVARSLGVSGTPGFFVNDTSFAGAYGWAEMESAL